MTPPPASNDRALLAAARRVLPVFSGRRLVAMRELLGLAQADVAAATGITASALSQAERGATTLSATNLVRVALLMEVAPDAFAERPEPRFDLDPQFRHLRRTPMRQQRRAERLVHATAQIATILREVVEFPEQFSFAHPVDPDRPIDEVAGSVEHTAARTRAALDIHPDGPVGSDLIGCLERGGVTVVRDPDTDPDIDAYSAIVDGLPVIVLDGSDDSVWDRDNFNLAHELGHLVMHRGIRRVPGTRTVEAQAHRFAGAFLGPAEALGPELPSDLDWGRYLHLKRRWGMSMAALVRRAKDLGVIDDGLYTRAMKQRSAHGWRFVEPGSDDRAPPAPRHLSVAAALAETDVGNLAEQARLPRKVVARIVGDQRPSLVA
jgi:Zn-dependent peptidase ImmA (M78 family)/transcriptional regulator with XRE-family HTH domain